MIIVATTGTGIIEGGWEFVIASYALTWLFFIGYGIRLFTHRERT